MSGQSNQQLGDGQDNYSQAAQKMAEAGKQLGKAGAQGTAAQGAASGAQAAAAGAEATANASAAVVQAGVEGGKAAANVAAGTAAGGPVGAILSAAWSMRHTLFKILICICLMLLFLVAMVVSLPSIIFNSIFQTDPASVPASGPTDAFAVFEEMSGTITGCVNSGYDYAKAEVERIIADGGYDYDLSMEATVDYGHTSADYDVCYILAAYSASMEQRGTTKEGLIEKLNAVTSRMFPVTYEVKETQVSVPSEIEGEEDTVETVYYVQCTIHPFDSSVILTAFGIDPGAIYSQFNIPTGDAIENMAVSLKRTLYGVTGSGQVPAITDAELIEFLNNLTCSPARKELMRVALSLVGRVPYFWGGKSAAGWNDEWNTPKLVTSTGSSSSGTIRPYGLDCSGYTDWVYKTALDISLHGDGSKTQWETTHEITAAELLPGDVGFMDRPGAVPINHMLLYAGTDASGNMLWVHCSSSAGGVALNSPSYVKYYRRINDVDLEAMTVQGGAVGTFTAEEVEWLAALVYYEARGMDSYCRELTAQVAVNRMRSNKFPNTLKAVIQAPGQYGYGVAGATATLIFDKAYTGYMDSSVWANCMDAAVKAASGSSVDENGNRWPANVLYQHSFESPTANGTGLFKTYRTGAYWMHFNYG